MAWGWKGFRCVWGESIVREKVSDGMNEPQVSEPPPTRALAPHHPPAQRTHTAVQACAPAAWASPSSRTYL
jgi:hypothetical protein